MSSASFSTSGSSTTKKGFRESDVLNFLQAGNLQTIQKQKIGAFKPPEVTRRDTVSRARAGKLAQFFGAEDRPEERTSTGFLGKFSDITSTELDSLTSIFLQRSEQLRSKRAQPGRSALFLSR